MDKLKRYADIKLEIKRLEAELDELKPMVIDAIYENGSPTLMTDFGTFSVKERRTWEYSEKIHAMEAGMKKLKKFEEDNGIATIKNVIAFPQFYEKGEGVKD